MTRDDLEALDEAEQVDVVLTVGTAGAAFHLVLGLVGEALGLPIIGRRLAKASLGLFVPLFALWMIYRFYVHRPDRQTRLSEWEDSHEQPPS